jgi:hypothetical protein
MELLTGLAEGSVKFTECWEGEGGPPFADETIGPAQFPDPLGLSTPSASAAAEQPTSPAAQQPRSPAGQPLRAPGLPPKPQAHCSRRTRWTHVRRLQRRWS